MAKSVATSPPAHMRPIDRLLMPIHRFLRIEAAGGLLLLACTAAALVWANSPWAESYDHFWHTPLMAAIGPWSLELSLAHFVNDALMAVFFFVVGLEIKRELLAGELASPRRAAVPIAAAIGGMIVPALIYVAFNARGGEALRGWAIPTATDIAFAVGVMAILGRRVPLALKVFVTAAAIVDDVGAVAIIALFYTSDVALTPLVLASVVIALSAAINAMGVRRALVYFLLGLVLWLLLLSSGVHATIGGVLMAFTIPSRVRIEHGAFSRFAREMIDAFDRAGTGDDIPARSQRQAAVESLEQACEHARTPLGRLEEGLHPWVAFLIMPIFALANAGVTLGGGSAAALTSGVGLGIALGLIIGKPVGIVLGTFAAVRLGLGQLPAGVTWRQIIGSGMLCGIGFTMSLFITNLAFEDAATVQSAKAAILAGSLVAGVVGFVALRK